MRGGGFSLFARYWSQLQRKRALMVLLKPGTTAGGTRAFLGLVKSSMAERLASGEEILPVCWRSYAWSFDGGDGKAFSPMAITVENMDGGGILISKSSNYLSSPLFLIAALEATKGCSQSLRQGSLVQREPAPRSSLPARGSKLEELDAG